MLERPPGGATMRWPVRLGLLSSIWAPERHRADHLSPAPLAPPEGRAGALSSPASGMLSPNLGWVQAPRPPWGSLLSALCPWGPGSLPCSPEDTELVLVPLPVPEAWGQVFAGACCRGLGASAWGWAWSTQQCYLQLSEEEFEAPLLLLGRHP